MERVSGVARSRKGGKIGLESKIKKPKTLDGFQEVEIRGMPVSSSSEVARQILLLRELQEKSEG